MLIVIYPFLWVKSGVLVKKWCLGVSWTGCEVADLKQRQEISTRNNRNKIQSSVLPTYDPGDAPDCMCEYGPCAREYGRMCHTTAQKFGVFLQPKLHLAFLVRLEPPNGLGPCAREYDRMCHTTAQKFGVCLQPK